MNRALLSLLFPLCCGAQSVAPAVPDKAPAKPAAGSVSSPTTAPSPEEEQKTTARQAEKLATALKLVRTWQDYVRQGHAAEGMNLWGYSAFDGVKPEGLMQGMENQLVVLGPLTYSEPLLDRSVVELNGTAQEFEKESKGVYVTLSWLNVFEKGLRRETILLHEPDQESSGMKIIGIRREPLPLGPQGAAELAADLGQLALLKLRGAPPERWAPWQREATALAENLKLTLPSIPDSATGNDKTSGEKLAALIMGEAPALFDKLGTAGGMHEAKTILNAFALLLLYEPGDETCTRLAVLAGSEAELAKLPPAIWKPLVRVVAEKGKADRVHETVQRMSAEIAAYLAQQDVAARVKAAPRVVLDQALAAMEVIPSYKVRGEFTATDGRKSIMTAALGPGAMYLQLEGFDGKKESHLATQQGGCHVSHDGEKEWLDDPDFEGAKGLCRTLQAPLERTRKFTEKHAFDLVGVDKIDGEQLFHFRSDDPAAPVYWVLMSKNGPVIRRASMKMKFGEIEASGMLIYRELGKEVEIPELELLPPPK
jgi:hypothetical protein